MKKIYLIEKTWIDNLENRNAWGYETIGFVEKLEEAVKIVELGGRHKKDDCWEMNVEVNDRCKKEYPAKYRYKEIENFIKILEDKTDIESVEKVLKNNDFKLWEEVKKEIGL